MLYLKSLSIFFLAGLCEIGGGYLVWLWLKEDKPLWVGVLGGFIIAFYGIVATWQPANFGRVYAAYGGVFIVMAVFWGWKIDGIKPDKFDIIGAILSFVGVLIMMYAPRK
ncbi:MAG: YnfA family protein [Daejeonella sp.]